MTTREDAERLDISDMLAPLRLQFSLPDGVVYLDGNSLGALPVKTAQRLQDTVNEWGTDLISSWNTARWMQLPRQIGDKIGSLIGAGAGEVAVADSTSVNLFKVLTAAAQLVRARSSPGRVIVSERDNFPTDLYIAESVAGAHNLRLELIESSEIADRLADRTADPVAVMLLTHVNYRTGAMHDMRTVTELTHAAGALSVWDLAHSAGAVEVDLNAASTDFAVGCGYKYLNGGPGAPGFVWVHPRLIDSVGQPLSGWMGHAAPFDFTTDFRPAPGITKFLCGTPSVLALAALDAGVDTVLAASALGGMPALRAKSVALTELFMSLARPICDTHDMQIVTPLDASSRGSQVSLTRTTDGYPIVQALINRGVVGDFRASDILRFGFTPLYTRFVDVYDACEHLRAVLASGEWRETRFNQRAAVT